MTEELSQCIQKVQDSVEAKNFGKAISYCQEIEIQLEEMFALQGEYPVDAFHSLNFEFHATFLLCLLRNNQIDEAKYLWKRTPNLFKPQPDQVNTFSWSWELGKLFFTNEIAKGIKFIELSCQQNQFSESITFLLNDLLDFHYRQFLLRLSLAYQPLTVPKVAHHLEITIDQANTVLIKYGYSFDESGTIALDASVLQEAVVTSRENKDLEVLHKLAEYTHHLQRESIKTEMAAINTNTSGNLPSPTKPKGQK